MEKQAKERGWKPVIIVMLIAFGIAGFWQSVPFIKNSVHAIFDPSAGWLLNWDLTYGMLALVFIISLLTTIIQKYTTDQETLKELKKEQKILQEEMKKYKNHPEKMMELQKKSFEFLPKTMKLSMRAIVYTAIPFILLFKWFWDFFTDLGNPKLLGFMGWIWFYILFSIIFSSILRKVLKVV